MRVLVTGANGYIGGAVCEALRRNGHIVYGLVRKEEHALELIQREIIPVIGSISDEKVIAETIKNVGVVIDTVPGSTDADKYKNNRAILHQLAEFYKTHGIKKRFIWTSGVLSYGDHPGKIVDESVVPITAAPSMITRIKFEKEIISSTDVEAVVVRPGWVYGGKGGSYIDTWYSPNKEGKVELDGNPDKAWGWVHIYDLADAFVRVAEASRGAVSGEIFDVSDDTRVTYGQVCEAMAATSGESFQVVKKEASKDVNTFSNVMNVTAVPSSDKIKRAVGWNPKCGPFFDNIKLYAAAAKASAKIKLLLQSKK